MIYVNTYGVAMLSDDFLGYLKVRFYFAYQRLMKDRS